MYIHIYIEFKGPAHLAYGSSLGLAFVAWLVLILLIVFLPLVLLLLRLLVAPRNFPKQFITILTCRWCAIQIGKREASSPSPTLPSRLIPCNIQTKRERQFVKQAIILINCLFIANVCLLVLPLTHKR